MTEPFERPEFPTVIDSTMRASYAACPKKFYWEFIQRLGPKHPSIHLHFGAVFARGLEVFRKEFYREETGVSNFREVTAHSLGLAMKAMIVEWGDYPADDDPPKTLWSCLAALDFYFEAHPPYTDILKPVRQGNGEPAVEMTFTLPLEINHPVTGEPLLYAGRYDMLAEYDGNPNLVYVTDEKTTSSMGPTWSSQWSLRAQFMGYVYSARSHGYRVAGAIARGVAIRKTGFDFGDAVVPIPNWMLERWWVQLHRDVRRMIEDWKNLGTGEDFGYNLDGACTAYGGCSFRTLCSTPSPENFISTYYARRTWNPLELDPLREARLQELPMMEVLK